MLKTARLALAAAVVLAATSASSFADNNTTSNSNCPNISRVTAQTFTLNQTNTRKVNDCTSQSTYSGKAVLTITPCGPNGPTSGYNLPVNVTLRTTTTENTCGDGYTDGEITITDPTTNQAITGGLIAVNENFGQLTGVLQGNLHARNTPPVRLRAAFNATFVKDANGNYTQVTVDAHGVIVAQQPPTQGGGGNGGHGDNDGDHD